MTNEQVNKIEDFLGDRMNPEEQKKFAQDLITDQELAAAYDTYRSIEKYMFNPKKYAREDAVKSTLTELGAEFFGAKPTATGNAAHLATHTAVSETGLHRTAATSNGRTRRMQFAVAAAVIFAVVIIGSWFLGRNGSDAQKQLTANPSVTSDTIGSRPSKQDTAVTMPAPQEGKNNTENRTPVRVNRTPQKQLFAAYFKPDALPADREETLKAGFELYEKGQYKQAADALEDAGLELSVRGEETDRATAKFYAAYYQALSHMATEREAQAIAPLKGLTAPNAGLQAKADWYLALCYVRRGPLEEAMPLLRKVSNNREAGAIKTVADRLMAELKK